MCKTTFQRTPQYLSYSTGSETPPKEMFWGCCFTLNGTGRLCPSEEMMNSTKYLEIWKKLGSNNAKIIFRWQWYFSAGQCTMPHFKKMQTFFFKVEINFARLAWQLHRPKPHRKLAGYYKKVSFNM